MTCDPNWPRGYCTLGDALLRLGSPLEALESFLDGARVARDAGRLEDAFELDRKGRDARDAVIMRRPLLDGVWGTPAPHAGPEGDGAFERAAQERYCPEGARKNEERHV